MDHLIRGDKASALVAADRGAALAPDLDVGAFARGVGARARLASSGPKAVATVLREHRVARLTRPPARASRRRPVPPGAAARPIACASSALQRPVATASLDEALATFTAIPAPFEVAVTRLDLARLAGTGGDREARAHLAEARAGFAALGSTTGSSGPTRWRPGGLPSWPDRPRLPERGGPSILRAMTTLTPSKLMGAEVKRKEDPRMITGTSTYVTDVVVPGMQWVAFVRSPHAHARIRRIDTKPALQVPGVRMVVTGDDIRKLAKALPPASASAEGGASSGAPGRQHWALSTEVVRHVGEAVAAVVADSDYAAHDGVEAVVVDWEPLPAVTDIFVAQAAGAPQLHPDAAQNIEHKTQIKSGDPDAVFAKAKRVVKQRIVSQRLCSVAMEPRACVAAPDPTTRGLVVWATHQAPHALRADLAGVLGMDQNLIRVINPDMGGGFGNKFGCYPEDVVLAALARHHRLAAQVGRDAAWSTWWPPRTAAPRSPTSRPRWKTTGPSPRCA